MTQHCTPHFFEQYDPAADASTQTQGTGRAFALNESRCLNPSPDRNFLNGARVRATISPETTRLLNHPMCLDELLIT